MKINKIWYMCQLLIYGCLTSNTPLVALICDSGAGILQRTFASFKMDNGAGSYSLFFFNSRGDSCTSVTPYNSHFSFLVVYHFLSSYQLLTIHLPFNNVLCSMKLLRDQVSKVLITREKICLCEMIYLTKLVFIYTYITLMHITLCQL